MKFCPTSLPPLWSNAPCHFVDKKHQTNTTSLWLNLRFCIQTISKTSRKFKVICITKIRLVMPKIYVPRLTYTSPSQFLACSQNTIKICHCVLHKKCHDNFMELSCGDSFRIIVFKFLTLLGLC
jgi:hypothetical protein